MKFTAKVGAAVAIALMSAGAAHAGAIVPGAGDGSLLFFVTDTVTNQTYTDVLTQDVNGLFSATQATSPAPTAGVVNNVVGDASFSVDLSSDANLTSFITAAGSDTLNWGIVAGAYTGSGSTQRPTGTARFLVTSNSSVAVLATPEGSVTGALETGFNADTTLINTNVGAGSSTQSGILATALSNGGPGTGSLYGSNVPFGVPTATGGSSVTLYGLSGNGKAAGAAIAYDIGTASFGVLGADVLSFTGVSAVPLPAAVWLFGSGLLGLAGVGRRRALKTA